ncbi:hypothetical protein [Methylobacterium fujisawaense]|uniref:hypothetical protein n=1 Tax=Methylobacterium fujisawaense TaxID=107400 RepID=UPI00313D344B
MSATLAIALPLQPMRAVLVVIQDRQRGADGQIVELEPHLARQIAADLIQAADLAEARKLGGRITRLAVVSDISGEREAV